MPADAEESADDVRGTSVRETTGTPLLLRF
jgi:hypothetical protein